MYKYETHLHTAPVSKCAVASVREMLEFYKRNGYDGVFITNHFIDGNINYDRSAPYEEIISFYFTAYEEALALSEEIGIKVFSGAELSYKGTDFLVYGLDKKWFLAHPEIRNMNKTDELALMAYHGALIIQAHPFLEKSYIDHIRLYPRSVHGVEVLNASKKDFQNAMAKHYAKSYSLIPFAGSDNHNPATLKRLCGIEFRTPVKDEKDFIERIKNGKGNLFTTELE